jgi:hypothetical protein
MTDIVAELDRWLRGSGIGQFAEILPEVVQRARDEILALRGQQDGWRRMIDAAGLHARHEAMEEAARVCERNHDDGVDTWECAQMIRALKEKRR